MTRSLPLASRYRLVLLTLALLLPLFLLLGAGLGAYPIPPLEIPRIVLRGEGMEYQVLTALRFPRVLGAGLVGALLALAGGVGFLGLVAPHLFRLLAGPDHRFLLPGAALLGASLAVAADLLARTLAAPAEIPVGVLTALLGGPFFLYLVLRYKREVYRA